MKKFFLLVIVAAISAVGYAREIKGKVTHSKKGVPQVVVSDGFSFAVTDAQGNYTLNASDEADFVFIVTPSGYMPECDQSTPKFYRSLKGDDFDFQLFRFGVPGGTYRMLAAADPQPRGDNAFARLRNEAFVELRNMGEYCREKNIPVFSVFLGDILYDNLDMLPYMKGLMEQIKMPVWPVIGNHDHNKNVPEDEHGSDLYSEYFGPADYAFNAGRDYYIVLDNIIYSGVNKYKEGLNSRQMEWIKGYLKFVPKGSNIFVAMHAPVYFYQWKGYKMAMIDELEEAMKDYKVTVITGHSHMQYNYEINRNMREYNIASIGGAWWLWDIEFNRDGTPSGYQVFDSNHKGITNFWKTTGKPDDYQFRVYPMGTMEGHLNDLCVKVWNWDNRWKVEWYEDGKYMGAMKQFSAKDPDYFNALQLGYILEGKKGGASAIENGYFYFSATPSAGASSIKIVVTDAYDRVYSEEVVL